jgi:hypothetical protein
VPVEPAVAAAPRELVESDGEADETATAGDPCMLESARLIPWAARVSVDAVEVEVGAKVGDAVCTGLGTDTLELAAVLAAAGLNAATDAVSVDRAVAISHSC